MAIGALIIGDEILSGKRQDKHLSHVIATLRTRGLELDFAHYLGDDRERLAGVLRGTFASRRHRVQLRRHRRHARRPHAPGRGGRARACRSCAIPKRSPSSRRSSGQDAYPHRVLMAEFPQGSRIVPESGQSRRRVLVSRPSLLPGISARWRGRCSTGCSPRTIRRSCRSRRWSARSRSTTRARASCCR